MRKTQKILIVDDEAPFRTALHRFLERDYLVFEADTGGKGYQLAIQEEPDLILLDIGLPDTNGLEMLPRFKELRPSPTVVMVTAYEHVKDVVLSIKQGAFDYLVKPVDLDEFELTVQNALEYAGLKNEVNRLRNEVQRLQKVDHLIGKNPLFLDAQMLAIKSAQSRDAGVLLQGESGAGKELFARLIHAKSPRAAYPFVALNCAAFSAEIIESELFGYERGAFTGARAEGKEGLLEVANDGTLFLDEVVDLHPEIQAKLLRVLEEREFYPLGGTKKRRVDVRIVSACNQDLWQRAEQGLFRKDLFFRLATVQIDLPPLRQRPEDILPLAQFFMEQFNDKYGKRFRTISSEAKRVLHSHSWQGNARELRNAIERVVLLENEETILGSHLHFLSPQQATESPVAPSGCLRIDLPEDGVGLEDVEREVIRQAYDKCSRNKSRTARFLKIPRHILTYRLKKLGVQD
jgi:DNA-binding NtrC family response regulator